VLVWVGGTDFTVRFRLVSVQIGTAVLVRVSVSVWNWYYGKNWAFESADWYNGVVED
jgi:hypothetical protein